MMNLADNIINGRRRMMNEDIKALLLSNNEEDVKLGIELLYRTEPEWLSYISTYEWDSYFVPSELINYLRYNKEDYTGSIDMITKDIMRWRFISEYCNRNDYYTVKGMKDEPSDKRTTTE